MAQQLRPTRAPMNHITPVALTGLVIIAAAIFFGRLAIQHWRGQRRSIVECLGLQWDHGSATDLLVGFAITTLVMLAIFACEMASGSISRGPVTAAAGMPVWKATLIMLFAAPEEELVNRSVLLSGLAIAFGGRTKLAVILSAVAFGLGHLANPGASAISALGNTLGGLIYGYAFVMSGRLWLPIGLHFAWNFVQGPMLGFPVSGKAMGGLQQIHDLGPAWLTGGAYGPEAGAIGISFRFVVFALVVLYVRLGRNKDRRREFEERVESTPVERADHA
jgi:membrane protease YdiL (CAAX protease family)